MVNAEMITAVVKEGGNSVNRGKVNICGGDEQIFFQTVVAELCCNAAQIDFILVPQGLKKSLEINLFTVVLFNMKSKAVFFENGVGSIFIYHCRKNLRR